MCSGYEIARYDRLTGCKTGFRSETFNKRGFNSDRVIYDVQYWIEYGRSNVQDTKLGCHFRINVRRSAPDKAVSMLFREALAFILCPVDKFIYLS